MEEKEIIGIYEVGYITYLEKKLKEGRKEVAIGFGNQFVDGEKIEKIVAFFRPPDFVDTHEVIAYSDGSGDLIEKTYNSTDFNNRLEKYGIRIKTGEIEDVIEKMRDLTSIRPENRFKRLASRNMDFLKGKLEAGSRNIVFGNSEDNTKFMIIVYDAEKIEEDSNLLISTIERCNGKDFRGEYNRIDFDKYVKDNRIGINFSTEKTLEDFIKGLEQ